MNVLVTGGAGAIGGSLIYQLAQDRAIEHVTILDDLSSGYLENLPESVRMTFIRGSVTDDELLKKVFRVGKFHAVIHFAANFANQSSVEYPRKDLEVNGMGTLKVLEYSLEWKIKRFVFSSSSCVYGHKEGILKESDRAFSVDTPYGATKLLGERYVEFFHQYHGLDTVILRYFNSYGPGEWPGRYRNVIPNFMYLALQKKPLPITGTGHETRDFNYVSDTVFGTIAALKKKGLDGKVFNLGSGKETSILHLATEINRIANNPSGVVFINRRKWDKVLKRRACIDLAKRHLHYKPCVGIREGLRLTHEWFVSRDFKNPRAILFQ